MADSLKQRVERFGRFRVRGLIYVTISLAALMVELIRFGLQRPFGLVIWSVILGIGLYLLFFVTEYKS